jgi:hypothetical protein
MEITVLREVTPCILRTDTEFQKTQAVSTFC